MGQHTGLSCKHIVNTIHFIRTLSLFTLHDNHKQHSDIQALKWHGDEKGKLGKSKASTILIIFEFISNVYGVCFTIFIYNVYFTML